VNDLGKNAFLKVLVAAPPERQATITSLKNSLKKNLSGMQPFSESCVTSL
jgi:hypothetical protein